MHRIAGAIARRLPLHVDRDDLKGVAGLALAESAARWRPDGGASFETYTDRRVRGAILDHLRRLDLDTGRYRRNQNKTGAIAAAMHWRRPTMTGTHAEMVIGGLRAPNNPEAEADAARMRAAVVRALERLNLQQRYVIMARCWRGMTLVEVADALGVTEARIHQIQRNAWARMRPALEAYAP